MITTALLLATACALSCESFAFAQTSAHDWPSKPVRILAGSAPGGSIDTTARAVADRLGPLLKLSAVIAKKNIRLN